MSNETTNHSNCGATEQNHFEIGGEDLFASVNAENQADEKQVELIIEGVRKRVGELLKIENVSVLLGAGASKECGGPMLRNIPLEIELELCEAGITQSPDSQVKDWLLLFYKAVKFISKDSIAVTSESDIIVRYEQIKKKQGDDKLKVNYEDLLSTLHRWSAALSNGAKQLTIKSDISVDVDKLSLEECIRQVTKVLANNCNVEVGENELLTHKNFIRKLLSRPFNLKRVNIFTLNYDTLIEQAADSAGIELFDGFVGTNRRYFRPESYEQDLHIPIETTKGKVHPHDRVLRLYKLHGSITWKALYASSFDSYGVEMVNYERIKDEDRLLIYPATSKYGDSLGMPYAELFRRFSSNVTRPQSTLLVVGYGFEDEHVNTIIEQEVVSPSFTLLIVDPTPNSNLVKSFREREDSNIWIISGGIGYFSCFVEKIMPNLIEDRIRTTIIKTQSELLDLENKQKESKND